MVLYSLVAYLNRQIGPFDIIKQTLKSNSYDQKLKKKRFSTFLSSRLQVHHLKNTIVTMKKTQIHCPLMFYIGYSEGQVPISVHSWRNISLLFCMTCNISTHQTAVKRIGVSHMQITNFRPKSGGKIWNSWTGTSPSEYFLTFKHFWGSYQWSWIGKLSACSIQGPWQQTCIKRQEFEMLNVFYPGWFQKIMVSINLVL